MFTKETVLKEIHEMSQQPVTPETTSLLCRLMNIYDHCRLLPGGNAEEGGEKEDGELTPEEIHAWVNGMENADGTHGPHWPMTETEKARTFTPDCEPLQFYAVMNMMYSDYCCAMAKAGGATLELYALLSRAFLTDPDAQPHKLARYVRYIVAH